MPLPTPSRQAQRFLGDATTKVFHDLLHETEECKALEIIAKGKGERFMPDRLEYALSVGYKPCPHCLPEYVEVEDEPEEEPEEEAQGEGDEEAAAEDEAAKKAARREAALKRAAARKAARAAAEEEKSD